MRYRSSTPVLYAAFSDGPDGGNQAGVVLARVPMDAEEMRSVTQATGLPTVAFGVLNGDGSVITRLFTPAGEIAACGHASAAMAAEIYRSSGGRQRKVTVQAPGGSLGLVMWGDLDSPEVSMEIRIRDWEPTTSYGGLHRALGIPVKPEFAMALVGTGLTHLIVPVEESLLGGVSLDHRTWETLGAELEVDTFGIFAIEAPGRVSLRDICAPVGDTEEAASGTTSSAVAWHLSQLGLGTEFMISQGVAMGRPSLLTASVGDASVRISGRVLPLA